MLLWRLILGTGLIAALTVLCWLDFHADVDGAWLFPLAAVISVLAAAEAASLVAPQAPTMHVPWVVHTGNLAVVGLNGVAILCPADEAIGRLGWPMLGLAAGTALVLIRAAMRYDREGEFAEGLAAPVFVMVYVGVLLSFVIQLRIIEPGGRGLLALVSLIAAVKGGDIGAYTVGRLTGRNKMVPRLSPGKTWEGAAGALVFSCAATWLVHAELAPRMGVVSPLLGWRWLAFGVVVGLAGIIGDLAESVLKRKAGVKESSSWLPGFGGVLDLIDSLLLAGPAAYLMWALAMVGPFSGPAGY